MKQIPIGEASFDQLYYHASVVLGLEVKRVGASKAQVRAKIEAAAPGTTMVQVTSEVESPAQAQAQENTAAAVQAHAMEVPKRIEEVKSSTHGLSPKAAAAHHHDPKVEVFIAQSPEPGGERDVPVSVNGVQFLIKRDTWVSVPYRIFEALKHAMQTVYTPEQDDLGRLSVKSRDAFSYPFNTRNEPSEAEIAEWRERTIDVELA